MTSTEELYQIYLQHPQVVTDSRKITKDCLFFALKGPRFDGNKYAADALKKGAAYAVVDDTSYANDDRCLLVKDGLETLQKLANYHRQKFYIPILGITGSNGKTTTKELILKILASAYPTHCTSGNFNNHIGVPLTLLAMPQDVEVAIIEMGANHVGEVDALSKIADPTHGLITNIGKAHLEGFGGIEGVKKGKSELYRYVAGRKGVLFVNKDEPHLQQLVPEDATCIFYTQSDVFDPKWKVYETSLIDENPFVKASFPDGDGGEVIVQSHLVGKYNFQNIQTAIAVGRYFKVAPQKIKTAIESYIPNNNRSEVVQFASNTILLDAYNANPTSIENAINGLDKINNKKKIIILGDMLEMGEYSQQEHQRIYDLAASKNPSMIILVGEEFGKVTLRNKDHHFESATTAKEWWQQQTIENAYVLIKGSRGIKLEGIIGGD